MNLVIHDFSAEEWSLIADRYKDWKVISDLGGIRPCIGCFCCWTSGTGECVFKDGYHDMCSLIHEADEMVVMSRYTYGGFSSFVKNVFDRSIGYVLPEFETAYGEMHHKRRFSEEKPVTFCFRSDCFTAEDKEKAVRYVNAVCRNLRGTVKDVIFEESAAAADTMENTEAPAERSGILFIECSLRASRSNTRVFLKKLKKHLGLSAHMVSLASCADPEKIANAVSRAETVILGIPLYVDGIPASALRVMEIVEKTGTGKGCKIYAVVNNGLYESRQNKNLLSMIRDWCAESGCQYRGGLAIGAGEVVGTLMRGKKWPLWPVKNALSGIMHLAKLIEADRKTEDIYADPYYFPRWLYILIANTNWQRLKKAAGKH